MVGFRQSLHLTRAVAALGVVASLSSCGGRSLERGTGGCRTDGDCAADQRCARPIDRPARNDACGNDPICEETSECAHGLVCAPPWHATPWDYRCEEHRCVEPCSETRLCGFGSYCDDDGLCVRRQCDEDGAEPCSEHWRCDPEAALTASRDGVQGSGVYVDNSIDALTNHGCVRMKCDELKGLVCLRLWQCDPEVAVDPSGCVPERCEETGLCSEADLICVTESRVGDRLVPDPNGCVERKCDEGRECLKVTNYGVNVAVCDPFRLDADRYGCVLRDCENDRECFDGYTCDPSAPAADDRGCVVFGASSSSGGSSGRGGAGATGGGGTGGGGTGGSAPTGMGGSSATGGSDGSLGECVAR